MADDRFEILAGIRTTDQHWSGTRDVDITITDDGAILNVIHRDSDGDYTEHHFRLVPVRQQWVEVES